MKKFKILSGGNILLYSCDFGDGIAIGFDEGRRFIVMGQGDYASFPFYDSMLRITCELIPCRRSDLKINDTAYCTTAEVPDPDDLNGYCKILAEDRIVYVDGMDTIHESNADLSQFYWYKLKQL